MRRTLPCCALLLFVLAGAGSPWAAESASAPPKVTLDTLRNSPVGTVNPSAIYRDFKDLERAAEAEKGPAQRQRDYILLAQTAKTFGKNDLWRMRYIQRAIDIPDGEPELRKVALTMLAEAYSMGLGHDLPLIDIHAYEPEADKLLGQMLEDPSLKPWRPQILDMKAQVCVQLKKPDEAMAAAREAFGSPDPSSPGYLGAVGRYASILNAAGKQDDAAALRDAAFQATGSVDFDSNPEQWAEVQRFRMQYLKSTGDAEAAHLALERYREKMDAREMSYEESMRYLNSLKGTLYEAESMDRIEELVRSSPDAASLRQDVNNLSRQYLRTGEFDKILSIVEYYEGVRPQDKAFAEGMLGPTAKAMHDAGMEQEADALANRIAAEGLEQRHPLQQMSLAVGLRQGGFWPRALMEAAFQNTTDLLAAAQSPEEKAEILRRIALAGYIFNDADVMGYATQHAAGLPATRELQRDRLDIRYLEACMYADRKEPAKAKQLLDALFKDFPHGPDRKHAEDLKARLEAKPE